MCGGNLSAQLITPSMQLIFSHYAGQSDLIGIRQLEEEAFLIEN